MCGIFAVISKDNISNIDYSAKFLKIKHRGPDAQDYVVNEHVVLGYHRLAIMDLNKSANIILNRNNVYLLCNGEIYNYLSLKKKYNLSTTTHSDCEVVLSLYLLDPLKFLNRLNELDGDFALIVYDKNIDRVIVARDRIGVRPLYVKNTDNAYYFASESKAICDSSTLREFIYQINPGTYRVIEKYAHYYDYAYYSPFNLREISRFTSETAESLLKTILTRSVEKRLMSDRPVGFLLSGGLDSSLVASIANSLQNKKTSAITTFSIGLADSPDLKSARIVADYLKSDHHEVIITEKDILDNVENVIRQIESYDITTIRASIPMYLLAKYISEKTDIRVIFSGEGSDEIFGGYLYFHNCQKFEEFLLEQRKLVSELHLYDCLRADRTTAKFGLELRVPFLDADLVNFALTLDPHLLMPKYNLNNNKPCEKYLLRHAFEGYLPNSILWRQKEAFSDGVGYNLIKSLAKFAEEAITNKKNYLEYCNTHINDNLLDIVLSKAEAKYYMMIYLKYYNYPPIQKYWMPNWSDAKDPSATVLAVHNKNQNST